MYPLSIGDREESVGEARRDSRLSLVLLAPACRGFAGVHPHRPAEKRGSADQRERTALASPVDKLPPTGQLGVPSVFGNRIVTVLRSVVSYLFISGSKLQGSFFGAVSRAGQYYKEDLCATWCVFSIDIKVFEEFCDTLFGDTTRREDSVLKERLIGQELWVRSDILRLLKILYQGPDGCRNLSLRDQEEDARGREAEFSDT